LFGFPLFLTHQYIEQLQKKYDQQFLEMSARLFEYLAKEFKPVFDEQDLIRLQDMGYI